MKPGEIKTKTKIEEATCGNVEKHRKRINKQRGDREWMMYVGLDANAH